jgi:hypothetical protein
MICVSCAGVAVARKPPRRLRRGEDQAEVKPENGCAGQTLKAPRVRPKGLVVGVIQRRSLDAAVQVVVAAAKIDERLESYEEKPVTKSGPGRCCRVESNESC